MSLNVENKAHNGVIDSTNNQTLTTVLCDRCMNCPCQSSKIKPESKNQHEMMNAFCNLYSSDQIKLFAKTIKENPNVFSDDSNDGLKSLVSLQSYPDNRYNSVRVTTYTHLSKENRIKLGKNYDAFCGIEISCNNPETDIDYVILYVNFSGHGSNIINPPKKYTILKTIKDLKSNYVSFFECPLLLIAEPFVDFSIEVKYNTSKVIMNDNTFTRAVKLHWLYCDKDIRTHASSNFNFFK